MVSGSSSSSITIRFEASRNFQIFLSVFFVGSYLNPSIVIEDKYKFNRFLSEILSIVFSCIPNKNEILSLKNLSDLPSSLNKSKFNIASSSFLFNIKQF